MTKESLELASAQYFELTNKILQHYAGESFKEEVRFAKGEFFDNAGILDENSEHFELRMSQFFDWYFYTRELRGFSHTPLEAATMARELRYSPAELTSLEQLRMHRHSLFEFIKIKNGDVYIKDLLKNEKIVVRQSPWTQGFDSDEVFEARIIPFEDTWIFTRGFCFHPSDAKDYILSEVKKHRKDPDLNPEEMMLKLVKMRYKFERYRHVKIDLIYSANSKVGI